MHQIVLYPIYLISDLPAVPGILSHEKCLSVGLFLLIILSIQSALSICKICSSDIGSFLRFFFFLWLLRISSLISFYFLWWFLSFFFLKLLLFVYWTFCVPLFLPLFSVSSFSSLFSFPGNVFTCVFQSFYWHFNLSYFLVWKSFFLLFYKCSLLILFLFHCWNIFCCLRHKLREKATLGRLVLTVCESYSKP